MDPRSTTEEFMQALCVYREASGESVAGKAAVLSVIRNRVAEPHRFGANVTAVILKPYQFSSFNANDPGVRRFPSTESPGGWQAWLDCLAIVQAPLTSDSTDGANFYHDDSILPPWKAWLGDQGSLAELVKLETVKIGRLVFYRIPGNWKPSAPPIVIT